jgi:hypothetical protein
MLGGFGIMLSEKFRSLLPPCCFHVAFHVSINLSMKRACFMHKAMVSFFTEQAPVHFVLCVRMALQQVLVAFTLAKSGMTLGYNVDEFSVCY